MFVVRDLKWRIASSNEMNESTKLSIIGVVHTSVFSEVTRMILGIDFL